MTRKQKTPRQKIIDKLDDIVSHIVRERDGCCVQCGSTEKLTNGHVIPGRSYALRWDVREDGNCHCQCWGCNYYHVKYQLPYFTWYAKKWGYDKLEQLGVDAKTATNLKTWELQELYDTIVANKKTYISQKEEW